MRKSIKNYSAKLPVQNYVNKIQTILAENGADTILMNYEKGTGIIESLSFKILMGEQSIKFRLPTHWRKFQKVLERDRIARWNDEKHVQRVVWANMLGWVEAQITLCQLDMVQLQEVFLPYAVYKDGETFYNYVLKNPKLLLN